MYQRRGKSPYNFVKHGAYGQHKKKNLHMSIMCVSIANLHFQYIIFLEIEGKIGK